MSLVLAIAVLAAGAALAPLLARLGRRTLSVLLAGAHVGATAVLVSEAPAVLSGGVVSFEAPWAPAMGLTFALRLDGLSLLFALLVTTIGALVTLYAGAYLPPEEASGRFQAWLQAFAASMLGLVLADDAILLFVFWELTSVTSWLLIGFHSRAGESRRAAGQALLVTSGAGLALLVGLVLAHGATGTWRLSELVASGGAVAAHPRAEAIAVLVLAGAFAKSAQLPFSTWLPRAMQAPTPASAYLHAATMVKVGVYLVARLAPAMEGIAAWPWLLEVVAGLTVVFAAWRTPLQRDLKAMLAWATVGALGLLLFLFGVGTPEAVAGAMSYLCAHALYKGALFLVAGALDHETGIRDVAGLGGLGRAMPWTGLAAVLAAFSIAGLPPALGFVGKEAILEAGLHGAGGLAVGLAVVAGASFAAAGLFAGVQPFVGRRRLEGEVHEASPGLWGPALVLAVAGWVLGLAPGLLAPLVSRATAAVVPGAAPVRLEPWPGWSLSFALGSASAVAGALVWQYARRVPPMGRVASRAFDRGLAGLIRLAAGTTRLWQGRSQQRQVAVVLGTVAALTGVVLAWRGAAWPEAFDARPHELVVSLVIVAAAVATVRARARLAAITAAGVVGAGVGLLFVFFGAPDVAMTQFATESLVVLLFVLAFRRRPRLEVLHPAPRRPHHGLVALAFGLVLAALAQAVAARRAGQTVSEEYLARSLPEAHGRNVVNVILTDFRALDTMGEVVVLSAAVLGGAALLRRAAAGGAA